MDGDRRHLILFILTGQMLNSVYGQKIVYLPTRIDGLEGSCVVIPCRFTFTTSTAKITWFKVQSNSSDVIYNSNNSSLVNKTFQERASIFGNLAKGNCSLKIEKLVFSDEGEYKPVINPDDLPKSNTATNTTYVHVSSRPESVQLSNPGPMTEGKKNYTITCYAKHTCRTTPPNLSWSLSLPSKTLHEYLNNGQWKTSIMTTYDPKSQDNGKNLQCTSKYPKGQKSKRFITLQILYAPKMVYINISHETGEIKKGEEVTLICEGNSNPNITHYTWYKNNQSLIPNITNRSLYIDMMTEDTSGDYYCVAHNSIGSLSSDSVSLSCIECQPLLPLILSGVAGGIVLVLMILSVVLIKWKRKMANIQRTSQTAAVEAYSAPNIYMNIQGPHMSECPSESPYTDLQNDHRCPEYDQIQQRDLQTPSHVLQQTSAAYSEYDYEEIFPCSM